MCVCVELIRIHVISISICILGNTINGSRKQCKGGVHSFVNELACLKIIPERNIETIILTS